MTPTNEGAGDVHISPRPELSEPAARGVVRGGTRLLPRTFAVANQKGGVGKTTTTVNLGASLAELGYRVLIIDLDPQGNATTGLGIEARNFDTSIYDVLLHDVPAGRLHRADAPEEPVPGAGDDRSRRRGDRARPAFSRELRLRKAIELVRDDFAYVLIDCPPSLGLITVNGLAAATEVLVPIQCEYYALEGLGQLLRNVDLVRGQLNPELEVIDDRPHHVRRPDQARRPGGQRGADPLRRRRLQDGRSPARCASPRHRRSASQ